MTCIVGLLDSGKIWMGGDSATVAGWSLRLIGDRKVFRNGEALIGVAGQPRVAQLLRFSMSSPVPREGALSTDDDALGYMVTEFVPAVRQVLKDGGVAEKHEEREAFQSKFLVGLRGRLFTVHGDYQVGETTTGFAAIGCGDEYAIGSLATSVGEPEARIEKALQVAAQYSAGVSAPFFIKSQ